MSKAGGNKKRDVILGIFILALIIFIFLIIKNVIAVTCSQNSDCGRDGCAGWANYCCENEVCQMFISFFCNNPGTENSYCSNNTFPWMLDNCTAKGKICKNGFCVFKQECTSNEDCSGGGLINTFCKNESELLSNFSVPVCENERCGLNYSSVLNSCEFGCSNGMCNNNCSDGTLINTCSLNKPKLCNNNLQLINSCSVCGCINEVCNATSQTCYTPQIICNQDADCGNDNSILTCSNNSIVNLTTIYGCFNNSCLSNTTIKVIQDCGNESYSINYCLNGNVVRNHLIPGCLNSICFINNITETVENCSYGCLNGKCKSSGGGGGGGNLLFFCGNNNCESWENPEICPQDCKNEVSEEIVNLILEKNLNSENKILFLSKFAENKNSTNWNLAIPIIFVLFIILLAVIVIILVLRR